ncbi:hypothetical protein CLV78_10953 [Aliiruegeria haliotis]|uniref:Uncharacterized protein n=1 Tax=Aliiruegeria haliotis TaxID=1280846 RepID=A0A2T0RK04_9RHOB|nr:hypothetical protein [Aliiruegeria haliotis]PRY21440.1 hypothetical protein CLV78_10953 [Aliiruegeria haliotis]
MIVILFALAGIVRGVLLARKRGGKALDMAQYGAGYGIALGLLGLFITIVLDRMLL